MSGPVEWAVLVFLAGLASGSMWLAWVARGMIARYELKYDLAIAALWNGIQDRNFLLKYELALAELSKDSALFKSRIDQETAFQRGIQDRLIMAEAELRRLGKIVNGKH
jgi:hypothetical protein